MREIKFRGMSTAFFTAGEWVYGYLYKNVADDKFVIDDSIVVEKTIGQYTGLTDWSGKQIYEGDVLSDETYTNVKGVVRFKNGRYETGIGNEQSLIEDMQEYELEIIGNIYENPELLEATK